MRLLKAADDILIRPKFVRLENGNITITESTEGSHGNPYAAPQYCITTPMEYGATYELIIEGCENVGGSMISASRITSRTQMEIKIETTQ